MHQYGEHFTLEEEAPGASTWTTLYDTDWVPYFHLAPAAADVSDGRAAAPTRQAPNYGMSCTWNNTTADSLAFPTEMCVAFTYYFPDVGQGEIDCEST